MINICYQQTGVMGNDDIYMRVNGIDLIHLISTEMGITHTISSSCLAYLEQEDIVSLRTNLSEIKMAEVGLSSRFILLKTL